LYNSTLLHAARVCAQGGTHHKVCAQVLIALCSVSGMLAMCNRGKKAVSIPREVAAITMSLTKHEEIQGPRALEVNNRLSVLILTSGIYAAHDYH
jgi:hypothetical protein